MPRLAYVLPESAVSGTDAVNFAGFPGAWTPGVPIAAAELARHGGFADEDEVTARIEELGLPLEEASVSADDGKMPVPANHRPNAQEAREAAVAEVPRPTSHKQADKLARERDFVFSRDDLKLEEKVAELFGDVAADEVEPLPDEPVEGEDG